MFTALGAVYQGDFWDQPWFYVGLGTAASATFLEPFFAKPQDAIVNSAAGIGAVAGVERVPVEGLWYAFVGVLLLVLASGLVATLAGGSEAGLVKWIAYRTSQTLGRAAVIGAAILALIVLTAAAAGEKDFEWLAAATAVLIASVGIDWPRVLTRLVRRTEGATAIAAIGPRMLLVAAASSQFREGDSVDLEAPGGTVAGSVVARLPHAHGLRYRVALTDEWTKMCADFPQEIILRARASDNNLVGAVGDGTTDRTLEFEPFRALAIGSPVSLKVDGSPLLYQVAKLRLTESAWAGAQALVSHATANLVGWPETSRLRGGTHLPSPHDLVYDSQGISGELSTEYYELGVVKETKIPIGIRIDAERRGHIAVLGMSGMGKTAVAQRICQTLGATNVVIALDTTGEYVTKLGFPTWTADDFESLGHSVYETEGDPPTEAAEFMKKCMLAGATEYKAGDTPAPRVVLLEEAHSFVPEWNFALRNQQDHVARTTRMIMQARKFGITVLMVSQRTAVVSKSALSQCENYIILKTLDQTSLEYLESLVGPTMRNAIPGLERFEAVCIGPAFNSEEPVIITLSAPV